MPTIYFATSNEAKVKNAQASLASFGFTVKQIPMELAESRAEDPQDIALEKARQAYTKLKKPVIVEDSGFFIDALGGFPKTHIKFSLSTLGITNILKMLRGVKNRGASWRMSVAYVSGKEKFETFTFVERGEIATRLRKISRETMSDYWRIYIPHHPKGNKKSLSEMSGEEMRKREEVWNKNNQFTMLGKWLKNK